MNKQVSIDNKKQYVLKHLQIHLLRLSLFSSSFKRAVTMQIYLSNVNLTHIQYIQKENT